MILSKSLLWKPNPREHQRQNKTNALLSFKRKWDNYKASKKCPAQPISLFEISYARKVQDARIWEVRWNHLSEGSLANIPCTDPYIKNLSLMIQAFQASLTRPTLRWYIAKNINLLDTWEEVADAFMKQNKFNLEITSHERILRLLGRKRHSHSKTMPRYAGTWPLKLA